MEPNAIVRILGLPELASAHGWQIDRVIWFVHLLMFVLFVGWAIYFIVVLFRFRKSKNPTADYHGVKSHFSNYLEVGVAIVEAILLVGLSIPFWSNVVNALPDEREAVVVHVIAEQFAWNVHYPGPDGIFGPTKPELVDQQSNPIGIDRSDPNAKDDITTINQLYLPVNKPALIYLTSKDVIHSFSLPVMRVKQDVIPGMRMPVWFTPIKTGKSEIACAQLCGLGHYRMRGFLTIETQESYDDWLASQAAPVSEGEDDFWN